MKVRFKNIGRNKVCFTSECKGEVTEKWLKSKVKPYVLSNNIEFYINGSIWAGMTHLGTFEILSENE